MKLRLILQYWLARLTGLPAMLTLSLTLSLTLPANVYATTPPEWKDSGFAINASDMRLSEVLNEFGKTYGVQIANSVKDQGVLKGRIKADNGTEFLDRLMHSHHFRWFVYSGTLYVVPRSDNVSTRIEVGEDAVQDAKTALAGVGLFEQKFGWGELPDEGVVVINGPGEYVSLARGILKSSDKKQDGRSRQVMVFKLKYANAADRVINTRGEKITVPGIKAILANLLNQDSPEKMDHREKFDAGSEKRSRSPKNVKASQRDSEDNSDNAAGKKKPATRDDKPRIDADSTINAVIIYDYASKREMYKELIAELDMEPQQIEIEALIVDIDRNKLSELGVEWGIKSGNTTTTVNATQADSKGIDLPVPGASLLISNVGKFYARLKAMEGTGEAHVLAKPTVLTLDNVAAVLDLSQTAYVPLVGERVADLANVTAGTMLRVVPRVLREAGKFRVRLEVDIEDGSIGDAGIKSNVTRSSISTQAIIDLQQTLMIGGYHSESRTQNQQKMPVLGDVPLLGNLFKSKQNTDSVRERLFLITPRLSGSSGMPAPEKSAATVLSKEVITQENASEKPMKKMLSDDAASTERSTSIHTDKAAKTSNTVPVAAASAEGENRFSPVVMSRRNEAVYSLFSGKRQCRKPRNWLSSSYVNRWF